MMKKIAVTVLVLCISLSGFAQERMFTSAKIEFDRNKNYEQAKQDINQALQDPTVSQNAKAWYLRAQIYAELTRDTTKYKDSSLYRQVAESYLKVIELKPDYEKKDINTTLYQISGMYFNDAAKAYNEHAFDKAYDLAMQMLKIHDLEGGKRLADVGGKGYDTLAATAKYIAANSAFLQKKYDEALPLYKDIVANHISDKPEVYYYMSEIYNNINKPDDALAIIEQGRKIYPNDKGLRDEELNYYMKSGKQDELIKKLEDAAAKEPNNASVVFDLGTKYMELANNKSPNSSEYLSKAEAAYLKAIAIDPENAVFNFNLGALYFNQGVDLNTTMNGLPSSAQSKYDEMKTKRDAAFTKALPYLEKAYNILDAKANNLSGEDKITYISTMTALSKIYAIQSKMDKSNELKNKINSYK